MSSPFKFLDAYQQEDAAQFFGREKETAQLYNAVFASNLTLLYGSSGSGKTSLINCGLANKFYETDWTPLFIRREGNINETLSQSLRQAFRDRSIPDEPDFEDYPIRKKLRLLYLDHFKPIYLIFDQLEELYILGDRPEQQQFYQTISELLQAGLQVKILIVIREEWIAFLNEFEKMVPILFDNRLRIEKMNDKSLYQVIGGTCRFHDIRIDQPKNTIMQIIQNLRDRREGVELTDLQVYLDRLYRKDQQRHHRHNPVFDPGIVQEVGEMKNVLSNFLDEQFEQMEANLKSRGVQNAKGIPLEILFNLVTEERTKKSADAVEILASLPKNRRLSVEDVSYCLEEFRKIKLLRILD